LERIQLGPWSLPLAVNQYTGGPPDWPARWVFGITGSIDAVLWLHVFLGGLLLFLVHRFLRFHGTDIAAAVAALALASDWNFLFYRKVLGGTEILLQAAFLLALWALWSRRWAGGKHGGGAIAVGIGLGLMAKATFLPTLLAFGLVVLLTRRDRPSIQPPSPISAPWFVGIVVLLTAPLWISWIHHGLGVPAEPHLVSHDYLGLQFDRAWSGLFSNGPSREASASLWWFLSSPMAWFEAAYQTSVPSGFPWRLLAWCIPIAGSLLAWRDKAESPSRALLRFMSLFVPLQLLLLWVANKDLHHLAQAAVPAAIWFGLAADRLAALVTPPRSPQRAFYSLLLCLPWMLGGVQALKNTDRALATSPIHSFTWEGQSRLSALLKENQVEHVWASDYDLYGMLEMWLPHTRVTHAWGDVSTRRGNLDGALDDLLRGAKGAHYLVVRRSAPMIYNLTPSPKTLQEAEERTGLRVEEVASLEDEEGKWARLYTVR
jgi:hypothetical protein